jgi:hypothetical protein
MPIVPDSLSGMSFQYRIDIDIGTDLAEFC